MQNARIALAAAVSAALAFIFIPSCNRGNKVPEPVQQDTIYPLGFCTDSFDLAEGTLKNGEIFTGLMTRLGMSPKSAMELISASDSVFNPKKMRAGNTWQA